MAREASAPRSIKGNKWIICNSGLAAWTELLFWLLCHHIASHLHVTLIGDNIHLLLCCGEFGLSSRYLELVCCLGLKSKTSSILVVRYRITQYVKTCVFIAVFGFGDLTARLLGLCSTSDALRSSSVRDEVVFPCPVRKQLS
ncbi:hypothetical protein M501DRAFT_680252 [Patellaria atrata CBS 101060]|uniref:Uncharacterized protein n=1 Tax=Patellaria atrata CBS 101060 TaxID=1346257 RepID=A0A9P4VNV5_9PEZI|nr:hypothetical protein M501DRAFT_680252 [Patellaria atrata CBS 101060]